MNPAGKTKREALLGELESIRALLGEDSQHDADLELLVKASKIPLLIPEEKIPTLLPEDDAGSYIPQLSEVAADTTPAAPPAYPPASPAAAPDPLDAIRQAAAKVASHAARNRSAIESTPPSPSATLPASQGVSEREKMIDEIVKAALPRLELLLRDLVQEALLKDKLRGGKR